MKKANKEFQGATPIAPMMAFNDLVINNVENAVNLQLDCMRTYTAMGMQAVNAGLEIHDAEDIKVYIETQSKVAQEFTEQFAADVKAFGDLGAKFLEDTRQLVETNAKAAPNILKAA